MNNKNDNANNTDSNGIVTEPLHLHNEEQFQNSFLNEMATAMVSPNNQARKQKEKSQRLERIKCIECFKWISTKNMSTNLKKS